jgi:3-methyladenine DNA glycosylase AlkC
MSAVPNDVLILLSEGKIETVNLMEWLAADMSALARSIARTSSSDRLERVLNAAADRMSDLGLTDRLAVAGRAIAQGISGFDRADFTALAQHSSDLVRQWACYAVNDVTRPVPRKRRLADTLRFSQDRNMSVREAAWMAFRPHVVSGLQESLVLLCPLTEHEDENLRRFAVEVSRPRSVWGVHIDQLKRNPELATGLLENVRADPARYVQLAVGNWMNDASKSRPDWVLATTATWQTSGDVNTSRIVRRALRTISRSGIPGVQHSDLFSAPAAGVS